MLGEHHSEKMPESMRRGIETLRVKFVDEMDSRILSIEAAVADIRNYETCTEAASAIAIAAHNLAGLAPSLGFEEIGTVAAETEQLWEKVRENALLRQCSESERQPALAKVEALLDLLEKTLEEEPFALCAS
ncbi:Hpt domain-containing protein [uncultured Roseovarius sp.]|uniref:Hpt domain-containing protein n=1 Tax=uncultured Roseovarius sp. TaxID=293344 RepID=UPI0025F5965E|nr:Hpt domain-containing protein [uncultured Roseovarius sp.]